MVRKRNYRSVKVKSISMESLLDVIKLKGGKGTTVGLDIAKGEIVGVIRWADASYERPFSVANPSDIGQLIELLCLLEKLCAGLTIGLESPCGGEGSTVSLARQIRCPQLLKSWTTSKLGVGPAARTVPFGATGYCMPAVICRKVTKTCFAGNTGVTQRSDNSTNENATAVIVE